MTFPFSTENAASRQSLQALADRLSDDDLARATDYGWSVAALFAHMAWWEQRMVVLLQRWQAHGVDDSPLDLEAINESMKPLCHALDPRQAVHLCLSAAAACDAGLEAMSPDLMAQIEASPNHYRFNRSLHRNDHMADIEAVLAEDA